MTFRRLVLVLCVSAAFGGCFDNASDSLEGVASDEQTSDPSDPGFGADRSCVVAADCMLAASTCCECPSFAVPTSDRYGAGCEDVDCAPTGLCPAVEATCDEGQCLMICSPLIADKVCSYGFASDEAGCLINECAGQPGGALTECETDADCVQVPADCCGCGLGGSDKALPVDAALNDADLLECPDDPACPGVDACNEEESAQCLAGLCTLAAAPGTMQPTGEAQCGTPALPVCATGFACVLNAVSTNNTSMLGVGTCLPN